MIRINLVKPRYKPKVASIVEKYPWLVRFSLVVFTLLILTNILLSNKELPSRGDLVAMSVYSLIGLSAIWMYRKYPQIVRRTGFAAVITIGILLMVWRIIKSVYQKVQIQSPIIFWIMAGMCVLLPLCAGLFLRWAYLKRYPRKERGTEDPPRGVRWWWEEKGVRRFFKENWFVVVMIIFSLHYIPHIIFPELYRTHVWNNPLVWALHPLLIPFALMIPQGKGVLHHKAARPMLAVVLVAILFAIFFPGGLDQISNWLGTPASAATSNGSDRRASSFVSSPPMAVNEDNKTRVRDWLMAHMTSEEWEKDGEHLVEMCVKESGCNQFEADNSTPFRGQVPEDVGQFQINQDWYKAWADRIEYDIYTWEGNLFMTLWIYHRSGLGEWNTSGVPRKSVDLSNFTLTVPAGPEEWSDRVPVWNSDTYITVKDPVLIRDNNGQGYEDGPGKLVTLDPEVKWIIYQSKTEAPVTVHIGKK